MTITATLLRVWAGRLCSLPALDLRSLVTALEVPGTLVDRGGDFVRLEPPPPGASRFELTFNDRGNFDYLDITLAAAAITRGELDAAFGAGTTLPRIHYDSPHPVAYHLDLPNTPFQARLIAKFTDDPAPDTYATAIVLRRDSVRPT